MCGCRVALVDRETVLGIAPIECPHLLVANGFGEDRRGRYRRLEGIALDDRPYWQRKLGAAVAIDQNLAGRHREALHRPFHRQHRGVQDIEAVDLCNAGLADRPRERMLSDQGRKTLALLFREFLRIRKTGNRSCRVEDHGRGNDRPAQGSPTGLVNPADHARIPVT